MEAPDKYVLIVDGDDMLLRSIRKQPAINTIPGIILDSAVDVDTAREKIEGNAAQLSVVVTSTAVARGSGEDVIRAAKKANPNVRIILFSGAPEFIKNEVRDSMFAVLQKPNDLGTLPVQIRRALMGVI